MDASTRIPMRWPCGPLEIERAAAASALAPGELEALKQWSEPRMLERLAGTPLDCLVVPWADGSALDVEHQRSLRALVAAARKRGLSLVGWVSAKADVRRALQAAQEAGLDAVATDASDVPAGPAVLRFRDQELADRTPADFLAAIAPSWPGPRVEPRANVDAETGPTGPPWLNSNAWFVRLARTLVRPKVLWLAFEPPELGQPVEAAAYAQAVADTEVFGGRWLVSLDRHLRAALAAGEPRALETWAGLGRSLEFFQTHATWAGYEAVEQLGVISDFAGPNAFLAFEVLNLLARQGGLARVLEKGRATPDRFEGLDAVLYVDAAPPDPRLARALYSWAEAGGTLVTPPGWVARGVAAEGPWLPRFDVRRLGSGRLAVARDDFADPYVLAEDAQLVLSHRHDRLRIFNPGTAQSHYAVSGDGRRGVLHTLVYESPAARTPTGVWFSRPWAEARAWSLDRQAAMPVARSVAQPHGAEFQPPPASVYSALELLA